MESQEKRSNKISDEILQNGVTEDKLSEMSDYIKSCIANLLFCHICSVNFNLIGGLRHHMKRKHAHDWLICEHCQKQFRANITIDKHAKDKTTTYRCRKCPDKVFDLRATLRKHQVMHKPKDNIYPKKPIDESGGFCNICQCNISKFLRDHMKICYKKHWGNVNGNLSFPCTLCESKPKSLGSLAAHMHLYHIGVKFDCDKCVRKFNHTYILEKHKREVHTRIGKRGTYKNETPQQCHICQKWCTRKWVLKNHIKSHDESNFIKCKTCCTILKSEEAHDLHVENQHICTVCQTKICQKNQIKTHYNIHYEIIAIQCKLCKKAFNLKKELRKHEKEHENAGVKRPFICLICWKSFHELRRAVECELNSHNETWSCTICHQAFKSPPELRSHTLTHISDLFVCKICHPIQSESMVANKRTIFVHEFNLEKHINEVHIEGKANLSCHVCGKYFLVEVTLVQHINVKHKDCWFKCKFCRNKFRLKETLMQHAEKKHEVVDWDKALGQYITKDSPETPNIWIGNCHICNFTFKDLPHVHMKQVHPEEFVTCTYQMCGRKFRAKVTLENHFFRDHLKNNESDLANYARYFVGGMDVEATHKSFSCSHCGNVYKKASVLRLHILNLHVNERNLQCPKCAYKTNRKYVLKMHIGSHDKEKKVSCKLCDMKFKVEPSLRTHYKSAHFHDKNGGPRFSCKSCDFTTHNQLYLDGIHQRRHTGEKPHSCPVCDRKFARKFVLKSHCKLRHGYNKQHLMDAGMYSNSTLIRATVNGSYIPEEVDTEVRNQDYSP